jgi:adenylate kinase family enzyme
MNIFILGLPKSGRTTLANEIVKNGEFLYIDTSSWIKSSFRIKRDDESQDLYDEDYYQFYINKIKVDSELSYRNTQNIIDICDKYKIVIDNLIGPKDFIQLFDYNKDIVIFLNRIDYSAEYKDFQSIGLSVMRDYCYWLAAAGLLPKSNWIEYNFRIPGEDDDHIKILGNKNSVYLVKSLNKVISHFKEKLINHQDQGS